MASFKEIAQETALLGSLFYADPAEERILAWLARAETADEWGFGQPDAASELSCLAGEAEKALADEEACLRIHRDYNRFFVGPFKLPASPWGSVYTDPEGVLFGNNTLGVRQWMRDNLVKVNLKDKEPEDHFGLMLLMVSWAAQNDVPDEKIAGLFEEHLLPWSGRYLELLEDAASRSFDQHADEGYEDGEPSAFFASLARLARCTLHDWRHRYDLHPAEVKLSR